MSTTAYLDEQSEELAKRLQRLESYDSISQVVKDALRLMERNLIEKKLAKKYRKETQLDDEIENIQSDTASDLGDYSW